MLGYRQPEDYRRTTPLNAGVDGHTSTALRGPLRTPKEPLIETDLSNIYQRETFRQHSDAFLAAKGVICGVGPRGYLMGLRASTAMLELSA